MVLCEEETVSGTDSGLNKIGFILGLICEIIMREREPLGA